MAAEQGRARGKASAATATRVQNALIDGSLCGILERLDEDPAFHRLVSGGMSIADDKDIAPIILVEKSPLILMVGAGLKTSDVAAIIAAARSKPGELTFASSGVGGAHHLSGELFANIADIQLTHVPYKGGAPASADLMGGQVSMMFEMGYAALPSIQSGKARPVAVTSNHRLDILPDVPTMAEAGVKDFESYNWQGIIGPAGLPAPIVERLNKELNTILADPEMKQLITSSGGDVVGGTPEAFGKWIHDEAVKWGAVVKAAKIEPQ